MRSFIARYPFLAFVGSALYFVGVIFIFAECGYALFHGDGVGFSALLVGMSLTLHLQRSKDEELEPTADEELEPAADEELEPAADEELEPAADDTAKIRLFLANELLGEAFKMATNPGYFEFAPNERAYAIAVARDTLALVESMAERRGSVVA